MKLLIAGAGGHGRVVADAAECCGKWTTIDFLDDDFPARQQAGSWQITGTLNDLERLAHSYDAFIAAFGEPGLRISILSRAQQSGLNLVSIVHPDATIAKDVNLGAGTVVFAQSVINTGCRLGAAVIVNTGATVDHDCVLADGVHICPGAHLAGDVKLGSKTWFGIGSVARQGITIGASVVVGAGSVCVKDIRDNVTVYGVPASER